GGAVTPLETNLAPRRAYPGAGACASASRRRAVVRFEPADARADVAEDVAAPAVAAVVGLQFDPGTAPAEGVAGRLGRADRDEVLGRVQQIIGATFREGQLVEPAG